MEDVQNAQLQLIGKVSSDEKREETDCIEYVIRGIKNTITLR